MKAIFPVPSADADTSTLRPALPRCRLAGRASGLLVGVALGAVVAPVGAISITETYVGTLSAPLTTFGSNPANNPGQVTRGNKYLIKVTYETGDITAVDVSATPRLFQTRNFHTVALDDAPGGTNTFELFIPSQGFGEVLTQTGQDHFVIGPTSAQTAELHFFGACSSAATCAAEFRGFEFESNFIRANSPAAPDPTGDIIFELRDTDANLSGTTVTNQVVNVLDGDPAFALEGIMFNGGTGDVRSESAGAAGGQQNPGVFLSEAVEVIAEAGASPLVYSAGVLSLTTDAGTEQVTDPVAPVVPGQLREAPGVFDDQPRQADNDLGAGRTDGEDFLTYQWTVNGAVVEGNQSGSRLNRIVETLSPGGSSFVNDGTRAVDNVNITRSIQQSGLQTTTDTTTFDLLVTEGITALTDTDNVAVSYANAGPVITDAGHTTEANFDITFFVDYDDVDLGVNALIPGFELLTVEILVDDIDQTAFFSDLLGTGGTSQLVSNADLISTFGPGLHTFRLDVSDRVVVADALTPVMASFDFLVQQGEQPEPMPAPGSLAMLALGLVGYGFSRRRRRF